MTLDFTILKGDYSIYRLEKDSAIPAWIFDSDFFSVTRTQDELSIVCKHIDLTPDDRTKHNQHWRILKIIGPLELSLVGIIADVFNLLKENKISIFVISTFDTDYIIVKNQHLDKAVSVLKKCGHGVLIEK